MLDLSAHQTDLRFIAFLELLRESFPDRYEEWKNSAITMKRLNRKQLVASYKSSKEVILAAISPKQ